jgi:xylulokinase
MKEYPFCMVLDIGTTNIKCCIISFKGSIVSQATTLTPYKTSMCQDLDPEEVWFAALDVIKKAISLCSSPKEIKAITVIGMAATYIPLSNTGNPLASAILWSDCRARKETISFSKKLFLDPKLKASIGQYPLPMYLPFKIKWMQKNHPSVVENTRWWVNITDYLNMKLTKRKIPITDYSIASRTMLLNHKNIKWNYQLLRFFEINENILPDLLSSGSKIGYLDNVLGDEIGLNHPVHIILGSHDHICTALGAGIINSEVILNSVGTSEAIIALTSNYLDYQRVIGSRLNIEEFLLSDFKALVGYVAPTGSILAPWIKKGFGKQIKHYDFQNDSTFFMPPSRHMKTDSFGILHLIGSNFSPKQIFNTIIYGLCFETRFVIEKISSVTKNTPKRISIAGGLAGHRYINQIKSDLLNREVEVASEIRLGALGGFILCGYGLGLFDDMAKAALDFYVNINKDIYVPDNKRHSLYEEIYHEYLQNISINNI